MEHEGRDRDGRGWEKDVMGFYGREGRRGTRKGKWIEMGLQEKRRNGMGLKKTRGDRMG